MNLELKKDENGEELCHLRRLLHLDGICAKNETIFRKVLIFYELNSTIFAKAGFFACAKFHLLRQFNVLK